MIQNTYVIQIANCFVKCLSTFIQFIKSHKYYLDTTPVETVDQLQWHTAKMIQWTCRSPGCHQQSCTCNIRRTNACKCELWESETRLIDIKWFQIRPSWVWRCSVQFASSGVCLWVKWWRHCPASRTRRWPSKGRKRRWLSASVMRGLSLERY